MKKRRSRFDARSLSCQGEIAGKRHGKVQSGPCNDGAVTPSVSAAPEHPPSTLSKNSSNSFDCKKHSFDLAVKIAEKLAQGFDQKETAEQLHTTPANVSYHARKLHKNDILKRIASSPAFYIKGKKYEQRFELLRIKNNQVQRLAQLKSSNSKKLFKPHKLGATYFIKDGPERWTGFNRAVSPGNRYNQYIYYAHDVTIVVYTRKLVAWARLFPGGSVREQVKETAGLLNRAVGDWCLDQGASLIFDDYLSPVDWVVEDVQLDQYLKKVLNLKFPGDRVRLGKTVCKIDRSHPDQVEVNSLTRGDEATRVVDRLEFLIEDAPGLLKTIAEAARANAETAKLNRETLLATLTLQRESAEHVNNVTLVLEAMFNPLKLNDARRDALDEVEEGFIYG